MKNVLVRPIVSEKATSNSELKNVYTFEVCKDAKKINIKNEVEKVYGVHVEDIRTMIYYRKTVSKYTKRGVVKGKKKAYKKAMVKVKEGQVIDIYNL